jgi:HD-GYP domain-containing protein (c-di-GMP phosphodiesterase class II)
LFAARCATALASHGDGFTVTAAYGVVLLPAENADPLGALNLADARMYRSKNTGRPPAARQSTDVLIALLAEQAPDLGDRMRAVCVTACATAVELGLQGEDLEALRHAAALHDIGKIGIPSAILDKPGPLSDAEWQMVRRHPLIGERILAVAPALARSARIVRSSHERLDGGGYPDGLAGEQIPFASRIVSAADAFHAMISPRAHVSMLTVSQAYGELRRCAGTQFDAAVVDALARAIGCDETDILPLHPTRRAGQSVDEHRSVSRILAGSGAYGEGTSDRSGSAGDGR